MQNRKKIVFLHSKWQLEFRLYMNVSMLIKQYFALHINDVEIDVFDEKNIYAVYQRVIETLTQYVNIETTLIQPH